MEFKLLFDLFICRNLQMEYVDLYLVHWPMAVKPSKPHFPMKREDIVPLDLAGVWRAMEECHRLGLAKMIGISNFTTKKLKELLATAKIPPAVNQVRVDRVMNSHTWQQFLFHCRYDNRKILYMHSSKKTLVLLVFIILKYLLLLHN